MNAPDHDAARLSFAEYLRLRQVQDVLDDINAAAWESMERKDFGDSAGELAKLDQVKPARKSVQTEVTEVWNGYIDAQLGKEGADKIRAEVEAETKRRSRRVGRSR